MLTKLDLKHVLFQTQRVSSSIFSLKGTWCSGITSASHAEGPGFNPQCVHAMLAQNFHWSNSGFGQQLPSES